MGGGGVYAPGPVSSECGVSTPRPLLPHDPWHSRHWRTRTLATLPDRRPPDDCQGPRLRAQPPRTLHPPAPAAPNHDQYYPSLSPSSPVFLPLIMLIITTPWPSDTSDQPAAAVCTSGRWQVPVQPSAPTLTPKSDRSTLTSVPFRLIYRFIFISLETQVTMNITCFWQVKVVLETNVLSFLFFIYGN